MGYYASLLDGQAAIPNHKVADALEVMQLIDPNPSDLSHEAPMASQLAERLGWMDFQSAIDDDGDVIITNFDGKWRTDKENTLEAISPYVLDTSLSFRGEQGEVWTYSFDGGKMSMTYDEES